MLAGPAAGSRTLGVMRRGTGDGTVRFRTRAALTIAKSILIDQLNVAMTSIRFPTTRRHPRRPVSACRGRSAHQGNPDAGGNVQARGNGAVTRAARVERTHSARSRRTRLRRWRTPPTTGKRTATERCVRTTRPVAAMIGRRVDQRYRNGVSRTCPAACRCNWRFRLQAGKVKRERGCQPVERGWAWTAEGGEDCRSCR